ncbi:hypothetical protein B8W90_08210 [Staphylococcus hominis]|nr:hypothetical protein B8W90_08210 [Staphylococcus hominis]
MNNKNSMFLVVILLITVDLIVFYLAIDKITHFKNAKDTLKILISIIGLFTTFGGAYLGAYLSGNNAIKQYKFQEKREAYKDILSLLDDINKVRKEIRKVNTHNMLEIDKVNGDDIPKALKSYKDLYKKWEDIYIDIKRKSNVTDLRFDDIKNFREPTQISMYLESKLFDFIEKTSSGRYQLKQPEGNNYIEHIEKCNVYITQTVPNTIKIIENKIKKEIT